MLPFNFNNQLFKHDNKKKKFNIYERSGYLNPVYSLLGEGNLAQIFKTAQEGRTTRTFLPNQCQHHLVS